MGKVRTIQSALNAGEISPKLRGRTDIPRYQHGLELCRNAIPLVWGGAQRLPGTGFVAAASGSNVRLIDFSVSINGALAGYVLELGDLLLRIYYNGEQIQSGGVPYEIVTPYAVDELYEIRFTASANVLYFFHPQHFPKRMSRKTGDTDWLLENIPFTALPVMRPPASDGVILTPSATSGNITLTANIDYFTSAMVGLQIYINGGNVTITAVTDARNAAGTVDVATTLLPVGLTIQDTIDVDYTGTVPCSFSIVTLADFGATTLTATPDVTLPPGITITKTRVIDSLDGTQPSATWKEQIWSDTHGYPACGTFFEQRMVLGCSPAYPTYVWGSKSGDPLNFAIGTLDDEGWAFNLSAVTTSLYHLVSTDNIGVFAGDKELTVRGGSDSPITPSNIQSKSRTPHGTGLVRPIQIGGEIYFVPPSGMKLRGFVYQFNSDNYTAPDVAVVADHLITDGGGIKSMAYVREPYSLLWVITNNGTLLTFTLDKEQEVTAWAAHGDADSRYLDCVFTPGTDGMDRVWFAVQRLVGGQWITYIEILDVGKALQTNSTITASGVGLVEVTGLDHLEGCLVDIKLDGFYGGRVTVIGGKIDLPFSADYVEVGLPYRTIIKDLPLELANPGQTIHGTATSVNAIRVRLHESAGCSINGDQVPFSQFSTANSPVELFSGDKEVCNLGSGTEPELTQVTIEQDLPFPLTVLAIIKEVTING